LLKISRAMRCKESVYCYNFDGRNAERADGLPTRCGIVGPYHDDRSIFFQGKPVGKHGPDAFAYRGGNVRRAVDAGSQFEQG